MRKLILPLLIACSLNVCGQTAHQWLSLTPIRVEKPALANVKDVDNKVFTDAMLIDYSGLNIGDLIPDENKNEAAYRHLKWSKATLTGDTVMAEGNGEFAAVNYYAVYLSNELWIKGTIVFKLFGNAEIYLDGEKKLTCTGENGAEKNISCELVPGKHTLLVKTVGKGGKAFAASFKGGEGFEKGSVEFSCSPKRGKNIYDILNGISVNRASLSPSGKYAIVSQRETFDGESNSVTNIYRVSDKEIVYSFYGNNASDLQWMPGIDRLSFLIKEGKGYSLYSYDVEQQQQSCLIKQDKQISGYTWSPDRSYLIYYVSESFGEEGWKLKKLSGVEDRQEYYRNRSYLCKFDFNTGLHSRLTWGNLSTSLMDISHNGEQMIFSTSYPDYNEYPYTKQSVYLLNMKTCQLDTLWKNRLYSISCNFSPDDKQLLISGGPSAFGKTGENIGKEPIANQFDNQLYIYDLATKETRPITKDFNPSVSNAVWHTDGTIYLQATDADYESLFRYDTKNGSITKIACPGETIRSISLAEKGNTMMYLASEATYPKRIYTMNLSDEKTEMWSDPAKAQYENIEFGEVKEWNYNYKKGTVITGRFYLPPHFDPNKKYPLIVHYYGGTTPTGRDFGGRYPLNLYAANGYVVYVLQPSGSIGFGQEFSARHQNNWCKVTGDEIIASTKAFIREHSFVDATKVGCIGASYGGFTTMYLTMHSDIFACAISHAGISSLSGYWGDGYWGYSYSTSSTAHAFPWNRKDIYVDQSPLFSADKAHNPILLIHGTKDTNVPTAQSMQLYTALKLLGKDAELVFVNNADHHVLDYSQRILWNNTILAYFAKYLQGEPAWWQHIYKEKNF